jgi:hypothetical protein
MTSTNDRSTRWGGGGPNVEETQHMGRYGPVVLGWLKWTILFFIYSKEIQIDLNRFDQKMILPNLKIYK